ncbi:MAG: Fe-S protein assembly co-chaperone HscB [Betaproteobacteria bacterium]
MIDFSQDYFSLFGLPARYDIDVRALDVAYRRLQGSVHPDRHAGAGEAQRRMALQASARVNEAYRTLKNSVDRAEYLLKMQGVDALAETDTALPQDFLEYQLERREAIDNARLAHDARRLDALLADVRGEGDELTRVLADELRDSRALEAARRTVRKLKFLSKVAADIDAAAADVEP